MDGVTRRADYAGLRVTAAPDIDTTRVFRVASQTSVQDSIWRKVRKGYDTRLVAPGLDVILTRPMAALASGNLHCDTGRDIHFIVGISKKLKCNIRMTCAARSTASIFPGGSFRSLHCRLPRQGVARANENEKKQAGFTLKKTHNAFSIL